MSDSEIILRHGGLCARVSNHGASLRGLWHENADGSQTDIVTGYSGADNKVGGQGDVLIPFPGRIKNGTYTFGGETFQMGLSDKEAPNAIHGFVRQKEWVYSQTRSQSVALDTALDGDIEGYPFVLEIYVWYTLDDNGLTCRFDIVNQGDKPAPVAAGFHPYFTVGGEFINDAVLTVPFDSVLEFDANLTPTGTVLPVAETPFDFREARTIGEIKFNTCYLNPVRGGDGRTTVRLTSADGKRGIAVWMADEAFDAVVLYSGDPLPDSHRRRSLAIEPMTGGSDVFNHPEWGLRVLEPGDTFEGEWGVSLFNDL